MHNIASPLNDGLIDFDRICASRNKENQETLSSARTAVSISYANYKRSAPRLDSLGRETFPIGVEKTLRSNFSRLDTGQPCADIRDETISRTRVGQCPYCSLEDASSLDHILEKKSHPEFAVLRLNLAPVCDRCNREKEHGRRRDPTLPTFHLYFDGFPLEPHLEVRMGTDSQTVVFDFELLRPPSMEAGAWHALQAHYVILDLAKRYSIRAQKEMNDRAESLQRLRRNGGREAVSDYLNQDARSSARYWGDGYWLSSLLRAAAQDENFCNAGIDLLG